jgi:tRNA threonylcarbamoyladenosine biosynthesis protein TsaB
VAASSLILLLEAATDSCSVAIADGTKLIAQKYSAIPKAHDTLLAQITEQILKENNISAQELTAVAISKGPGSYMGLRIAVALAKAIAYSANIKLISVSTLTAIAECARQNYPNEFAYVVPMIDAGRMEVYTTIYNSQVESQGEVEAKILDSSSYRELLNSTTKDILFTGNGADKFKPLVADCPNAHFLYQMPQAQGLRFEAYKKLEAGQTEDVAYFQPFYLKEFIPGKQKKLL